jgi:PPK2 family polyphosphate:nucleotide phosphotransferase
MTQDAHAVRQLLRARGTRLAKIDPRSTPGLSDQPVDPKSWSRAEVGRLGLQLAAEQEKLFGAAEAGADRRRVLLVLQAMDCGGKDGTIRAVVSTMNPLGLRIQGFRAPSSAELAQDYLWRVHRALPPAGYVGVFNRSHYEDVLAVRVRSLVPEKVWRARFDQINAFEEMLAADGLTIIKVMLHISYEEQRERLLARLDDPTKHWKFNPGDIDDRALWTQYQQAYADVLARCDTAYAPWYVVPADRKWYRNWAVANIVLAHLTDLGLRYPAGDFDVPSQRARLAGEADAESVQRANKK